MLDYKLPGPQVITGYVCNVKDDTGFINADKECREAVNGGIRYVQSKVKGGRVLIVGDHVRLEAEYSDRGYRANWVEFLWSQTIDENAVEGEGYVKYIAPNGRVGFIQPDVKGADVVRFYSNRDLRAYWTVGDRIKFIAKERHGKWRASHVQKLDRPTPVILPEPPARDWRDSWREDTRC